MCFLIESYKRYLIFSYSFLYRNNVSHIGEKAAVFLVKFPVLISGIASLPLTPRARKQY